MQWPSSKTVHCGPHSVQSSSLCWSVSAAKYEKSLRGSYRRHVNWGAGYGQEVPYGYIIKMKELIDGMFADGYVAM